MIFIVRLKSERDPDETVRALRWLLKIALRRFGLRCLELRPETAAWREMWRAPLEHTNPDFRE